MTSHDTRFSEKLNLAIKVASIGRGRVAAEVGVDKSLVSRWLSGAVQPSSHNIERLTRMIAAQCLGFNMLDWEHDLDEFAQKLGVTVQAEVPPAGPVVDERASTIQDQKTPAAVAGWIAQAKLQDALQLTDRGGVAVCGIWRSTRPSPEFPGKLVHDHVIIEPMPGGALSYRVGAYWARFTGWAMFAGDQLYTCATGQALGTTMFSIYNRVHSPCVDAMDGVTIAVMADAGGIPCALACYIERIANLSGDAAADNARFEEFLTLHPVAPEGTVPAALMAHLMRDTGPQALANGGDPLIMMRSLSSMSRGHDPALESVPAKLRLVGE